MAMLEVAAISSVAGAVLGGLAALAKARYEGGNKRAEIEAARDEQESQQAERVISILKELLAEERARVDKFQQQSESLSDELSANKAALLETQAEVRMLRKELAEQMIHMKQLYELLEEHKIPYLRAVKRQNGDKK